MHCIRDKTPRLRVRAFTVCACVGALVACAAPPEGGVVKDGNTWTFQVSRDLAAGEEQNDCVTVVLDETIEVAEVEPVTQGYDITHHLILWRGDVGHDGVRDCGDALPLGVMGDGIYATGTGDVPLRFADGATLRIARGSRLTLNAHFLNATGADVRASASLVLRLADKPADKHVGLWSIQNYGFAVPPLQDGRTEQVCAAPQDTRVHAVVPHMHEGGTRLEVLRRNTDGTERPWLSFEPALDQHLAVREQPDPLLAGDEVVVRCTIHNPRPVVAHAPDEMCNVFLFLEDLPAPTLCVQ